jgi:hypothetical protein
MKGFKVTIALAVMLVLSAIGISGVANGQTFMVGPSGNVAFPYLGSQDNRQDNSQTSVPVALTYANGAASGQSIIFENGVPTTVIGADGAKTSYSESMFDFVAAGYNVGGPYGVGISSNPDVPIGGTWKQVTQSGTLGTQEPNLKLN